MSLDVISRSGWNADSPHCGLSRMSGAVDDFFVHHTVTNAPGPGASRAEDAAHMRLIQDIAFGRGFCDFSYSFAAFRSGRVFQGRGWGVVGAHTLGWNARSYAVVLPGNYERDEPTAVQLAAIRELIAEGKRLGHVARGAAIRPHRSVSATSCPGSKVMAVMDALRRPITQEDELAAEDVWTHVLPGGGGSDPERAQVHMRAQTNMLRELLVAVGKTGAVEVDEAKIAAAVLEGLEPAQIAAAVAEALEPALARKVADELAARLTS